MKLSDIVGHAGLDLYAQIALVLFLLAFLIVVVRLLLPSEQAELRRGAVMPLDDPNDRLARLRVAHGANRPE